MSDWSCVRCGAKEGSLHEDPCKSELGVGRWPTTVGALKKWSPEPATYMDEWFEYVGLKPTNRSEET
jgi:hypothetical protein